MYEEWLTVNNNILFAEKVVVDGKFLARF